MCGIFAILNKDVLQYSVECVNKSFMLGQHRGPENSVLKSVMIGADYGFHRLAINGLNDNSNQPICLDNIVLICNGEIYNYKELYKLANINHTTDSDCEIIIHLYKKYGMEQTLQLLDGVFAFCLIDYRFSETSSKTYIARDPYGVRPLYIMKRNKPQSQFENNMIIVASELKMIKDFYHNECAKNCKSYNVHQFNPGTYATFELIHNEKPYWKFTNTINYHSTGFNSCIYLNNDKSDLNLIYKNIQYYLINAVEKRCSTTDRPIACLLSGGLDSSLITSIVNEYHKKHNLKTLETYSIGIEGSDDLKYAKKVADYLKTNHTEIVLQEKDFLNAIPDVIKDIESYDTTTVRASIGNWLIGKHISNNSNAKVIFNGDGSDEVAGGYLYVGSAPDSIEYDKECRRLLKYIHTFDVLRSDKCISSHGLEPRTPFLDREWIQYYLSIPIEIRCKTRIQCNAENIPFVEKYLIRNAFNSDNYKNIDGNSILPEEILFRRKEAFSDGVSKETRSLHEIIDEHAISVLETDILKQYPYSIDKINYEEFSKICMKKLKQHLLPDTAEKLYYRYIFEEHYSGLGKIIPHYWMPKYLKTTDSSARTLSVYHIQDTLPTADSIIEQLNSNIVN